MLQLFQTHFSIINYFVKILMESLVTKITWYYSQLNKYYFIIVNTSVQMNKWILEFIYALLF